MQGEDEAEIQITQTMDGRRNFSYAHATKAKHVHLGMYVCKTALGRSVVIAKRNTR